jgi:hypothetical protein
VSTSAVKKSVPASSAKWVQMNADQVVVADQRRRLVHRTDLERKPKKWAAVRCGQNRHTYRVPQMSIASPSSAAGNRAAMIELAFRLEYMTLAWMLLEAVVSIGPGPS